MSDPIRDAAIEAAARDDYARSGYGGTLDDLTGSEAQLWRETVTPLVDAVLAVALPEWRKHAFELRKTAIREARAEALRDAADDFAVIPHPYEGGVTSWLRDRANAEEGS